MNGPSETERGSQVKVCRTLRRSSTEFTNLWKKIPSVSAKNREQNEDALILNQIVSVTLRKKQYKWSDYFGIESKLQVKYRRTKYLQHISVRAAAKGAPVQREKIPRGLFVASFSHIVSRLPESHTFRFLGLLYVYVYFRNSPKVPESGHAKNTMICGFCIPLRVRVKI